MKKFFTVKNLCLSGIIAALYAGLTILLQAISFGPVQIRVAEAMTLLPLLTPAAVPGLAIGCFVANLICSTWQDWVFGTLATLIAAVMTRKLRNNLYLAAAMPVVSSPAAYSRMALMSAFSRPPWQVKNLKPLRLKGRWLAVIITEPSNS